jgi:hypothetical protein
LQSIPVLQHLSDELSAIVWVRHSTPVLVAF